MQIKLKYLSCFWGLLFLWVISSVNVSAQKSITDFKLHNSILEDEGIELKVLQYKSTKSESSFQKGRALEFAHQFTVNYTPQNCGNWFTLKDGTKIWKLRISSPGAYSINLIFDRYVLPEGAKLLIYNVDQSQVLGAFTSKNNKKSGILATAPVSGDEIIVEYQEPAQPEFKGELLIGAVNHDYVGIFKYMDSKAGIFGESGYCEEDASCYDPTNSIDVRRSVVGLINNGSLYCTGTFINNTNEDGEPYVITAAHCLNSSNPGSADAIVAFVNYESPYCSEIIDGSKIQTISGADTKVYAEELDIALLLMQEEPDANAQPYFAGWTLETQPAQPYTCIHHPQGDVKKVSTSITTIQATSFVEGGNYPYAQEYDFHWRVPEWNLGTTEGGSSGAALFDANYKIIGTLTGGEGTCSWPRNDYFTRFYKGWDQNPLDSCHFSTWLDPLNTGVQSLDGFDPYEEQSYKRISNVEVGELPAINKSTEFGYESGHNIYGITRYAEKFTGIKSANLNGVYIMPGQSPFGADQTINLLVWEGSVYPENVLYKEENINIGQLRANREIFWKFSNPVSTNGTFYVGYEIDYSGSPIDSFAVYHTQDGSVTKTKNTMMVEYHNNWEMASDVYGGEMRSLWIDVLADMVVLGDTQVNIPSVKEMKLYPNPLVSTSIAKLDTKGLFVESYSVIDINGSVLDKQRFTNSTVIPINIDLSDLPDGLYIIEINHETGTIYKKIVKASQ
ncbi:trypsin-like peptidase domain-containing protein [Plebeiibacterium sediminum]|uniref:Trypsin-like peptidase domain-containing protein n=1 Tax=Plebeiibacterium sediminum TaxID=2992112 RepID=A0AAE3M4V1_9BACT|nr:trypsin-like peptidase domain-containing protein [Plebeiobacterium sediminum]MCW3786924.1 trypsin-like peptidase domain-containing protein [Plebeiobacterium sediminum]